eukprot:TRINITY_DN1944_c0_g1_i1.p1 TRINITY_DN1944_c0_g1~~TRINITY_DN1944_c0_g1_i1.p1  ORF type:complete len:267 (-),score=82.14 TRINITY_DN1944_c0_g1_i1:300-1100(-)
MVFPNEFRILNKNGCLWQLGTKIEEDTFSIMLNNGIYSFFLSLNANGLDNLRNEYLKGLIIASNKFAEMLEELFSSETIFIESFDENLMKIVASGTCGYLKLSIALELKRINNDGVLFQNMLKLAYFLENEMPFIDLGTVYAGLNSVNIPLITKSLALLSYESNLVHPISINELKRAPELSIDCEDVEEKNQVKTVVKDLVQSDDSLTLEENELETDSVEQIKPETANPEIASEPVVIKPIRPDMRTNRMRSMMNKRSKIRKFGNL